MGISACLLGAPVRFDGGHKRDGFLVEGLGAHVEWRSLCPELEAGLGVPREPVRLVRSGAGLRVLGVRSMTDQTAQLRQHAEARVEGLGELDGCVLKSKSPTCGMERVKVYSGDGGMPARDGVGVFAAALLRRWPDLPVEEDGRLHDPGLRACFVERVFVHRDLRRLWRADWRVRDLIAFHTAHKMTALAHDPIAYRRLGRLVAAASTLPRDEVRARYQAGLMAALARPPSPGRHANALQHLAGHLRGKLDPATTRELADTIDEYRRGLVPLVVPLTLLRHHVRHTGVAYAETQSYLAPHPRALGLHNHV